MKKSLVALTTALCIATGTAAVAPTASAQSPARLTALSQTVEAYRALGMPQGFLDGLEHELRDDIFDRDTDFERDNAEALRVAGILKGDAAKLAWYKQRTANASKFRFDDDYIDVQDAFKGYGSPQTNPLGSIDKFDDLFDDDIFEVIAGVLGALGIAGIIGAIIVFTR